MSTQNDISGIISEKLTKLQNDIILLTNDSTISTNAWVVALGHNQLKELYSLVPINTITKRNMTAHEYAEFYYGVQILPINRDDFLEILAYL